MNSRRMITALAVAAAVAVAGCGDDDKAPSGGSATAEPTETAQATSPATSTPAEESEPEKKAATPEASWANKLCTGLADKATVLQPPNVRSGEPKEIQAELIRFFTEVTDQIDGQKKVIKAVGAPPAKADRAGWEDAQAELTDTQDKVKKIRQGLRSADFGSPAASQKNLDQLGKDFAVLNQYLGPVASLKKDKGLQAAIEAEPACAQVS